MKNFELKKELDTTELIKWGTAVIGGLIVFLVITLKDYELKKHQINEYVAKQQEYAANQLLKGFDIAKKYKPNIKINYTNMLSANSKELLLKVYIKSNSENDIFIFPPKLSLLNNNGNEISSNLYVASDITSFQGSITPESSFQINYKISLNKVNLSSISNIQLKYEVQMDDTAAAPIKMYFEKFGSKEEKELFGKIYSKNYIYTERIYNFNDNPIWNDFWSNPR